MKISVYTKLLLSLGVMTLAAPLALANTYKTVNPCCQNSYKKMNPCCKNASYKMDVSATFSPYWYAGANFGVSHTHDSRTPGIGSSVTQIGPGWNVDLGYAFANIYNLGLAAELGYNQYHQSSENLPGFNLANTEHFAAYLAGVAIYPLPHQFGIFGKLGVAYSYAKKVFTAIGFSASANTYSPYYGLGVSYNITPTAALLLQWNRVQGNGKTGSTDLTSLGLAYAFV